MILVFATNSYSHNVCIYIIPKEMYTCLLFSNIEHVANGLANHITYKLFLPCIYMCQGLLNEVIPLIHTCKQFVKRYTTAAQIQCLKVPQSGL